MPAIRYPTIVVIPNAFSPSDLYDDLISELVDSGFKVTLATPESVRPPNPALSSCSWDARIIRETVLRPLVETGNKVVIYGHAYGGIVAGGAIDESLVGVDGGGQKGGVVGIIAHASMLLSEGSSMEDHLGGSLPDRIQVDQPKRGFCRIADKPETKPHALMVFKTPAPKPRWSLLSNRLGYVRAKMPPEIFPQADDDELDHGRVSWDVVDCDGSCETLDTKPEDLAKIIKTFVRKWSDDG